MARLANSSLVSGAVAGLMIWILVEKEKTVSSIYDFFLDGACIFLLVSLIAFVVSFLGWIGAFRENICCLKGYHWTMTILFFVQIVIVILIFVVVFVPEARNQLGIYPEDSLRVAIEKYRDDPDMQNLIDNFQLTDPLTRTAAIHTDGCLKAITDFMNNNVIVVGGVLMGVFIPQV
ncbi:TSN33-like protein [Mya arenaria]|uniref:TSN33-like protein n=1 Tax=Mya arenaria TaxID=6604 RepID=A0ABY7FFG7_MYAAR|nr:TSN33-like protein [Mya arenaria]